MRNGIVIAFIAAALAVLPAVPVEAQGPQSSGRVCFGGRLIVESGTTADSLVLFGCNVIVKAGGTVGGGTVVFGGNLTIENGARVDGPLAVFGGNVDVAGDIGGDITIVGGNVSLASTAIVNGGVRIAGGNLTRREGAVIRGGVSENGSVTILPPLVGVPFDGFRLRGADFFRSAITALAMAALGALLVVLFPAHVRRVSQTAQDSLGQSLGAGCLSLLVVVGLAVGLAVTLIGIPIAVLVAVVAVAAWFVGWIAIGYLAGERIVQALNVREVAPVLAVVAGVLVLSLVGEVPCIGGLVSFLVGLLGFGAVALTRFGTRAYPYTTVTGPTQGTLSAPVAAIVPTPPTEPITPPDPSQESGTPPR